MKFRTLWLFLAIPVCSCLGAPFDAAPFALRLPEGNGLLWEDPREIHRVIVHFNGSAPAADSVRLEYWGSRWPQQHLPKNREPGGGDVGWMELGNWYNYGWRTADTDCRQEGSALVFDFRPVNQKEFPKLGDYTAAFRYTLKLRVVSSNAPLPAIQRIEAFTDSAMEKSSAILAWRKKPSAVEVSAFNGSARVRGGAALRMPVEIEQTVNPDPNTFDRTLVTVKSGQETFTFAVDDLKKGALYLPVFGVAVLPGNEGRDYAAVEAEQKRSGAKTLYERVSELPEQTWHAAWAGMPPKKSHIYFPMGLDGGRQRFLVEADGTVQSRHNDHYLRARPGRDTPRLDDEPGPVRFRFGPARQPVQRWLDDESIPVCTSVWEADGVRTIQTALVTELSGMNPDGPVPPADALAVCVLKFTFSNMTSSATSAVLPVTYVAGEKPGALQFRDRFLWLGENVRAELDTEIQPETGGKDLVWKFPLGPGEAKSVVVKIPYLVLKEKREQGALAQLDFEAQRVAVDGYWHRRLAESAKLITPEPVLNEFYTADAGHLLINCEREPGSTRRFARVGSFSYGAYGNESCMMVVDLDRRGYHREAQECLEGWLHYQGTVGLPGDFSTKKGVLYGAGGYESGGYNQHHGWILWMLAEHYRFTRDEAWLRHAAPGIIAACDWIINETSRTAKRDELERGLLPAGSLEDIGDWWTWLSTSCYTWRGLDSAAWALEQIQHPDARRMRQAADAFHASLLANFQEASRRSPVVRLRDGTAVPKIPSYVHRRGRSFGWICETLEGSLHLLITGALDPRSREADWIVKDYEDNLFLSNQYGYTLDDFDKYWFGRGGMSMQACLLLDVEPYLYRDDVKQALRACFNALAVSHFPDVHMNTEHALPEMGDWRGDHYKSSDESNACGWLRDWFVRESGERLLIGQAIPREWLEAGKTCGMERAETYFGTTSVLYHSEPGRISATLNAPTRNPPKQIRLRFRTPGERPLKSVTVNGRKWRNVEGDWVVLPGDVGRAEVSAWF